MPQQDQQAYQPYQSIRQSAEALDGKSISAVNLGRTSFGNDGFYPYTVDSSSLPPWGHHDESGGVEKGEGCQWRHGGLSRWKTYPNLPHLNPRIHHGKHMNIWVPETKTREHTHTHTRDSPRSKNLVRFCMFLFLTKRMLKGIWICTRRLATDVKPWHLSEGSCEKKHIYAMSDEPQSMRFFVSDWLLGSPYFPEVHPVVHTVKHIQTCKKAIHTQYT